MIYADHPLTLDMLDSLTDVSESMRKHLYGRCIACGVTTVESLIGIKYDDLDTITGIGLNTKYRVLWPFIENMKEKLRNGEIKSEKPNYWSDEDRRDIVHNINDLMELKEFKLIFEVFSQYVSRRDSIKFIYEEYGKGSFFDRSAQNIHATGYAVAGYYTDGRITDFDTEYEDNETWCSCFSMDVTEDGDEDDYE